MATPGTESGPRVLGLTGPIACGKTTVGDMLLERGAIGRIDADQIVHELMAPGTETTGRIADEFGRDLLGMEGGVDRGRLGALVFGDERALRRLEAIVHPAVRNEIRDRVARLSGQAGVVVIDAVKLLQSELLELTDAVWVVTCSEDAQLDRLQGHRGMTEEAARARLAAMPPFNHPRVTATICNDGSIDSLRDEVRTQWASLLRRWHVAATTER